MKKLELFSKLRAEVIISSARSSGPGGQNVNKTNSKAIIHWDFTNTTLLSTDQKARFEVKFASKFNKDKTLTIQSEETRTLKLNIDHAIHTLMKMIESIWLPPKKRIKTKPTKSSQKERVDKKKSRGDVKSNRKKIRVNDY